MAGCYLLSTIFGSLLVSLGVDPLARFQARALGAALGARPIADVLSLLQDGRVAQAVGYTFAWNFGVAAILFSTGVGVIFFLPPLIGAWRGFLVGILFHGQVASLPVTILLVGTFLLEIGAYVVAGAAGMGLGFALLPSRSSGEDFRHRTGRAFRDILTVYPLVAGMLFCGALWEIIGIYSLWRWAG